MRIRGTVYGVMRDKHTGEVVGTFEGENHIQDSFLATAASTFLINSSTLLYSNNIFVSTNNPGEQRRSWSTTVANAWAGRDISGIPTPTFEEFQDTGVHLGTWVQEFDAQAEDVELNMCGLCATYNQQAPGNVSDVDTVVWFNSPCTWLSQSNLTVFYKIQFFFDEDWKTFPADHKGFNALEQLNFAQMMMTGTGANFPIDTDDDIWINAFPKINLRKTFRTPIDRFSGIIATIDLVNEFKADYYYKGKTLTVDPSEGVGLLVGMCGAHEDNLLFKAVPDNQDPVQGIFVHRSTSDTPFYQIGNDGSTLADITVDAATWDKDNLAQYIEILFTTGGGLGVGEYKYRKFISTGMYDNTFDHRPIILPSSSAFNDHYCPSIDTDESANVGFALCRDHPDYTVDAETAGHTTYPVKYRDNRTVVALWNDSFAVVDIYTGEGKSVHNTTKVGIDVIPRFLATSITQVAFDSSNNIYISCEDTGLYKFNEDLDTLTVINGASGTTGIPATIQGCQGIAVGNAGRLWAYFRDGTTPADSDIYYSDNGGTSWTAATFSDTFIDANPYHVKSIVVDPADAGGKMMLVYQETLTKISNVYIKVLGKWWDHALTTVSDGPSTITWLDYTASSTVRYAPVFEHSYWVSQLIQCSPNDGKWAVIYKGGYNSVGTMAELTFGSSATLTSILTGNSAASLYENHFAFVTDNAGNDAIFYISTAYNHSGTPLGTTGNHADIVLLSFDASVEYEAIGSGSYRYPALAYMGDGIWLFKDTSNSTSKTLSTMSNFNIWALTQCMPETRDASIFPGIFAECFPEYGWTGSTWAKGNANGKPFHAASEELYDNINVSFSDTDGNFIANDFFSFGVYDGIWQDGATTFDYKFGMYYKPSKVETSVEVTPVPAPAVRTLNGLVQTVVDSGTAFSDATGITVSTNQAEIRSSTANINAGGRSTLPAIYGSRQAFIGNKTPTANGVIPDDQNVVGYVRFRLYVHSGNTIVGTYGLVPGDRIGDALDPDAVKYGLRIDSTGNATAGNCEISVVEDGIVRPSSYTGVDTIPYDTSTDTVYCQIVLLDDGRVVYLVWNPIIETWQEIYRTPTTGLVPVVDYHFMLVQNINSTSYGIREVHFYALSDQTGNFLYLGNGSDEGVQSTEFYRIDPDTVKVTLDGVPAVSVGNNDYGTTLNAGFFSAFYEGAIRLSDSDQGKAITVEYVTLTHE